MGDVTHFRQRVQRLPVVVNELLPFIWLSFMFSSFIGSTWYLKMVGLLSVAVPSPLHLSLLPRKSTSVLVGVSDSVLLFFIFDLCPFLYVSPII
jgi:hypothetical protein